MLLELDNKAPIPAVNHCACCMAKGSAADLRKVNCSAHAPDDDDQPPVILPLPMCRQCRTQSTRFVRIVGTGCALGFIGAIVAAIVGYNMSGVVSALVFPFVVFVGSVLIAVAIFNIQRMGYAHHAHRCKPLAAGHVITTFGGGGAARHGVSKLLAVDFANEAFAKELLSLASARIRQHGSWSSLGICFDIDALEQSAESEAGISYDQQARLIFMRLFDPTVIGAAVLFHGDTHATLAGDATQWCIAVAVKDIAAIEILIKTFSEASDPGLAPLPTRFIHHARDVAVKDGAITTFGAEPLSFWLSVDGEGTIILPDPPEPEDVALCNRYERTWQVAKRPTH